MLQASESKFRHKSISSSNTQCADTSVGSALPLLGGKIQVTHSKIQTTETAAGRHSGWKGPPGRRLLHSMFLLSSEEQAGVGRGGVRSAARHVPQQRCGAHDVQRPVQQRMVARLVGKGVNRRRARRVHILLLRDREINRRSQVVRTA